ncbi:Dihydrolipoyllysine-residue acetyltransferase component of pyruvate dehydrogenase complex [Streptomyces sp. enrichment culture]|uniref:dihydrolipoamide acetyltransferase family protein n=1 Tax=Streptomyces sp. enrichment culture TaxID=1795815 RepID=UPI003F562783
MTDTAAAGAAAQRIREFRMPDVGEGLTEAEILKWYVGPGDTVTDGQVVCEVETAKAAVELPIPYNGVVHELRFEEGVTVDVGTPIITVDTDPSAGPVGSAGPAEAGGAPAAAPAAEAAPVAAPAEPEAEEGAKRQPVLVGYGVGTASTKRRPRKQQNHVRDAQAAVQAEMDATTTPPAAAPAVPEVERSPQRPLAKPPVRKLAKDLGVDLAAIVPTGPNGIITREDVHAAAAPAPSKEAAAPAAPAAPQAAPARTEVAAPPVWSTGERERRVPIKGVRRATAQAVSSSAFTAPHVTEFITVDVTRTMKLVQELKQDPDMAGLRVNPLLLVARAFLVAIRRNPEINAAWDEASQEIVHKDYVNLGIAAATPRGLIVPNIKDAHAKTLPELARALGELVATAKEGKTPPADMQGGTATITNVGVFGVDTGTPILNPGESAILAFGAVKLQPWVHKGKVKPRQVTTLGLSFDHRLVDGELGSKVLADTAAVLEHPKRLITWA